MSLSGSSSTGEFSAEAKEPAVILCVGSEHWLRIRLLEQLKQNTLAAGFEETDFVRFGISAPTQEILEGVSTLPFSAGGGSASGGGIGRRLVVVGQWPEIGPKTVPWLAAYLEQPNRQACLVLCGDQFEGRQNQIPPVWNRPESVRVVFCRSPEPRQWILQQAKELGKKIHPAAANLLVGRVGTSLSSLSLALEQLSLLVSPKEEITSADIQALIPPSLRESAFEILDSAGAGQTAQALEALHQGLALGQVPMDQFLGAFGWYVRMIWEAQRGRGFQYNPSPQRRQAMARLSQRSEQQLRQLLGEILEADLRLKLGHPTPEFLADRLLLRLGA